MMMTSDGDEKRCPGLRANNETLVALFCCLVALGNVVHSSSIADLLSDLEMEDNSDFLRHHVTDVDRADGPLQKRAPWAPYEVNVDNLRQKLHRSKLVSRREKHATPELQEMTSPYANWGERISSLTPADAFLEGYAEGWKKASAESMERWKAGAEDVLIQHPGKRTGSSDPEKETRMRSTGSIHPVYLGMGQETANAALSTFASLLAEEEKRKNSDHPVRFIGKRYAADE